MKPLSLLAFPASTLAGSVLWSGIFNSSATVTDFDDWSWSNQIEPWQWYIHGSDNTSEYLGLSSSYKNPAASDAQGLRTTIDGTSFWEGQTMERTELIPQTTSDLGSGHLYYHFSLSTSSTNAPNATYEHQIAFFESHFTELQYGTVSGSSGSDNTLRWNAGGTTHWSVTLVPGNWYNFAYDIDFTNQKVGLWASNGSEALTEVVSPVSASASSNSADWHVGVLRLAGSGTNDDNAEDWFWSGVYVEEDSLTKEIGDGSSSTSSASSIAEATTPSTSTSSSASAVETTSAAETTTSAEVTPTEVVAVQTSSTSTSTAAPTSSTSTAAPIIATPTATSTPSSSTAASAAGSASVSSLPVPTTAVQILDDVKALLAALLTRGGGVHARDFAI
ncbi:hypothetical protein BO94DRAFT_578329 [Aspergillus sclerotioniger CBS 115572]|uniref:Glycoside hydrolase 131 catalytic N-terminal domain-containing protein n=1 Tax=Aspergillus sclerotioniger CBS 115572 TaxID=1450535 RepID=A0A317VJC1_9EURO|nr:hypothetical protein BO94DRAFT_578329 [Aspergillus sclerotioniger CBS 115572]PWY73118.1 hypothetical protein BO94DRAFT_578329 [Aspergillus sclerotioniger CBS 115572]